MGWGGGGKRQHSVLVPSLPHAARAPGSHRFLFGNQIYFLETKNPSAAHWFFGPPRKNPSAAPAGRPHEKNLSAAPARRPHEKIYLPPGPAGPAKKSICRPGRPAPRKKSICLPGRPAPRKKIYLPPRPGGPAKKNLSAASGLGGPCWRRLGATHRQVHSGTTF